MKGNLIRKGQQWKSKTNGVILEVVSKSTGNNHWNCKTNRGNTHQVHEGTLQKFYELFNPLT
jgi:hypothetical protein